MFSHFILTVPHNLGIKNIPDRSYDLSAYSFAEALYNYLKKVQDMKHNFETIEWISSNNNRFTDLDDNRFYHAKTHKSIKNDSSLWNQLRQSIQLIYEKNSHPSILILDVHSFPNDTLEFKQHDVILLDNLKYQKVVIDFALFLKKNNITCLILPAQTGQNSILDVLTLHPIYIPTILFELNEKIQVDSEKFLFIVHCVASFISPSSQEGI